MKFLNNLDLQKNEIQNFRVHNLAAAPANPVVGQHYFNTVDGTEYVYTGEKWIDALSQGDYTFADGITEKDRKVTLNKATADAIGGVIVGDNIDVLDGKISVKDATNAQKGLIQLATDAEAKAGADEAKAVNAKQVKDVVDTAVADKIALTDLSATGPITYNNKTGVIAANIDKAPTKDSTNLVTSGAVEAALATKLDAADVPAKISDLEDDTETTPVKVAETLKDMTATVTELNTVKGVTAPIQTQIDAKVAKTDYATDKTALEKDIAAAKKAGDDAQTAAEAAQATADAAVVANEAITGATHTKITYDAKGLVTGGADLAETDIPDLHLAKVVDVTVTAAEVNELHEAGAVKADFEKLHGVTATADELNFVKGVTSAIQDQLDAKLEAADVPTKISDLTDDTATKPVARATADKDGNAIDTTYVKAEKLGVANGVATLDANGLVPAAQLPSYVDDVVDLLTIGEAPAECAEGDKYYNAAEKKLHVATAANTWGEAVDPEADKIYVTIDTNMSYRWSGTTMVQIGADKLKGYTGTIVGDDTTTTFNIDHNLGTRNVVFEVYEEAAPYEKVYVQVLHTSATQLQVVFSQAPAVGTNYVVTAIAIG